MANYTLGKDCKAYYSATALTSTSYATPLGASTLIDNIKDLKIDFTTDEADITTRASGRYKQTVPTLISASITFSMKWLTTDAGFTAIQSAFFSGAEIAFFALDGVKATAGFQGPAGNWTVTKFSRNEGLVDALMVDVELKPSSYTGWVTTA